MSIINKYKVVIAVVLPVLILVIIRSFGSNHFKTDANKWAEPSVLRSNIISADQIGTLPGKKLLIDISEDGNGINEIVNDVLKIPADSILRRKNFKTIRKHVGPVVLFSNETAVSARIWMVLSQLGYRNIYILTNDTDNEVFKNKFRPDTIVRPEL